MGGMDKTVIELAKEKAAADEVYGVAFRAHLRTFKPMDTSLFWEVIEKFSENISARLKYGSGVKDGAHNLLCELVYGNAEEDQMAAWEDMARFLACYELVTHNLSIKMADMPNLDRGDDGYGDLVDSLPLAGQKIVNAITEDDIANSKQLDKALADHPLGKFILEGENYICMSFEKVLLKAFVSVSREQEEEEREEARIPHVVVSMEPVKADRPWGDTEAMIMKVRGPFKNGNEAAQFVENQGGQLVRLLEGIVKR